jgi:hypothetical protein
MTTTSYTQPLLSTGARLATAAAVAGFVAAAWVGTAHESRQAVHSASVALSTTYITLPRVEIVAKREHAEGVAVAAAAAHKAL